MTFNFDALTNAGPDADRALPGSANVARLTDDELRPRRRALLVGQPNVGKSVVFGALTGTYVTVSNYPGTTVEITRGSAKFGDQRWEVVDTPGTHNLVPMSEDEAVTRDLLVTEAHDALVQVGDAKNLTRTLLLTLQLAELGSPFCLDLNMLDEARARGLTIDLEELAAELGGIRVNASTAVRGEGIDAVRDYLASSAAPRETPAAAPRRALSCAPTFPADVEAAIADVEAELDPSLPVAPRAVATMLLGGERGVPGRLLDAAGSRAHEVARDRALHLARAHGAPVFALLSRLRLARAQAIVRRVQRRASPSEARGANAPDRATWGQALAVSAAASLAGALVYDGAVARTQAPSAVDRLAHYGFFDVAARVFSTHLFSGWTGPGLAVLAAGTALGALVVRRCARPHAGAWKLVGAFIVGWMAYGLASLVETVARHAHTAAPVHLGAIVALLVAALAARTGDTRDAAMSSAIGRLATHRVWGLLILGVVLFLAYKVVGEFGAGTAVDFVENRVFGATIARADVSRASPASDLAARASVDEDGTKRLVVLDAGPRRAVVVAQVQTGGVYADDPTARVDVYARHGRATALAPGRVAVEGDLAGAEAREWTGFVNRAAFAFFTWIGVPLLTAFFVGPYGLITMGATYAVAIVMPVVATFFFVFSMLEDSGYLPRLAVMANRTLSSMGLNGRAVLPMVLGLGCDTMATLTARNHGNAQRADAGHAPPRARDSVLLAAQRDLRADAADVGRGDGRLALRGRGDDARRRVGRGPRRCRATGATFLLEMPPIRRPMVRQPDRQDDGADRVVPEGGGAALHRRDRAPLLSRRVPPPRLRPPRRRADRASHPRLLARGGVADRVSEALLVGFLRRDFGAAGLLELARGGPALVGRRGRLDGDDHALHPVHRQRLHDRQGARVEGRRGR